MASVFFLAASIVIAADGDAGSKQRRNVGIRLREANGTVRALFGSHCVFYVCDVPVKVWFCHKRIDIVGLRKKKS